MNASPVVPDLPPQVLRWVTAAVGPDGAIRSVRPVIGATSSELHRVEVERGGGHLKLVLRRFTNAEWLAEEPDLALHEATALRKAGAAGLPVPELIAYDERGAHCGLPAILMTELPGTVVLAPADLDQWLGRLAEAIAPLHTVEAETFRWHYRPYNDLSSLEVPGWSRVPELWERAIEIVNGPPPATRHCFIHRDYHPNNVLWLGDRVSGIIDWPNACRGAPNIDVAWCRGNLASLHGVPAADRFLQAYESVAGRSFSYHPFWDLIVTIEVLPGPPTVYEGWIAHGVRHLDGDAVRDGLDEYLVSVMARL